MKFKVYTDGASRGNPGQAAIGVLIEDEDGKQVLAHKRFIGIRTNNFAEYSALIESVKLLKDIRKAQEEVDFFCDSELVVKQVKGEYKIRHKDLINLSIEFRNEIRQQGIKFAIHHIPRELNKVADSLANEALDENKKLAADSV